MKITNDTWQLLTADVLQKEYLFAHAKACGVLTPHPILEYHTDTDPFISWFGPGVGLGSLPKRISDHRPTSLINEAQFLSLCSDYAVAHLPAPSTLVTR